MQIYGTFKIKVNCSSCPLKLDVKSGVLLILSNREFQAEIRKISPKGSGGHFQYKERFKPHEIIF